MDTSSIASLVVGITGLIIGVLGVGVAWRVHQRERPEPVLILDGMGLGGGPGGSLAGGGNLRNVGTGAAHALRLGGYRCSVLWARPGDGDKVVHLDKYQTPTLLPLLAPGDTLLIRADLHERDFERATFDVAYHTDPRNRGPREQSWPVSQFGPDGAPRLGLVPLTRRRWFRRSAIDRSSK